MQDGMGKTSTVTRPEVSTTVPLTTTICHVAAPSARVRGRYRAGADIPGVRDGGVLPHRHHRLKFIGAFPALAHVSSPRLGDPPLKLLISSLSLGIRTDWPPLGRQWQVNWQAGRQASRAGHPHRPLGASRERGHLR